MNITLSLGWLAPLLAGALIPIALIVARITLFVRRAGCLAQVPSI